MEVNITHHNDTGDNVETELSYPVKMLFTVLFAIVFIIGVTGNLLTSITILRTQVLRSTTNIFLCNLAVSDTLLLIFGGAPLDIFQLWSENRAPIPSVWFCRVQTLLSETVSCVSVGTIVIVTIERYLAICQPFTKARIFHQDDRRRLWLSILLIWILSLCPSILISFHSEYRGMENETAEALERELESLQGRLMENETTPPFPRMEYCELEAPPYIYVLTFIVYFVLPMKMIAVAYSLIVRRIHVSLSRQSSGASNTSATSDGEPAPLISQTPHIRARYMVIKMLMVVTVFFFTHLPMHIQRLITSFESVKSDPANSQFLKYLYNVAGVLQFGGAASNPFMYTAMSRKFRVAFKRLIGFEHYFISSGAAGNLIVGGVALGQASATPRGGGGGGGNYPMRLTNGGLGVDTYGRRPSFSRSPALVFENL